MSLDFESIDHSDAIRAHDGLIDWAEGEIRWVALLDDLVECSVNLHYVAEGTVDPLAVAIIKLLRRLGALSFDGLCLAGGWTSSFARRITAEVLLALEQACYVSVSHVDGLERYSVTQHASQVDLARRDGIVQRIFRFVPRSGQLSFEVPATTRLNCPNLPYWTPSDTQTVYEAGRLKAAIESACGDAYQRRSVVSGAEAFDVRSELLQRRHLRLVDSRLVSAEALDPERMALVVIHRCYFVNTTAGWRVSVRRFRYGPVQPGYTRYLRELCSTDAQVLNAALKMSVAVIKRH